MSTLTHAEFILAWNEFSDNVSRGFACHICRQQFDVVRDRDGFSIGILCGCPAISGTPSVEFASLN
jgi:hypothetical protein